MSLYLYPTLLLVFAVNGACFAAPREIVTAQERSAGMRITLDVAETQFHFRWCPPGDFTMGATEEFRTQYGDAFVPPHRVDLTQGFWILETEVTQAQFVALMERNPSFWKGRLSDGPLRGGQHPVEQVTWNEAVEFCEKLSGMAEDYSFRLPTEAEWEYACRAGRPECRYGPIEDIAWVFENTDQGEGSTGHRDVATLQPNSWGLHDMLGNVSEWCLDWYGPPADEDSVDPAGPMFGHNRVIRGGNCFADRGELARDGHCLAGARGQSGKPNASSRLIGFRIVAQAIDP